MIKKKIIKNNQNKISKNQIKQKLKKNFKKKYKLKNHP